MVDRPLPLPAAETLLAEAEARLRRQRAYARPLATPRRARALELGLGEARTALTAELRPAALWRPVAAVAAGEAVDLAGVALAAPRLAAEVTTGGKVALWLCTLGEDGAALRGRLGGDAMLLHLAGALAQQALYAVARATRSGLAAAHPGQRLRHVALRAPGAAVWDAEGVARLLPLLDPAPLGVVQTETGGFQPVHTLLGVAVAHAA